MGAELSIHCPKQHVLGKSLLCRPANVLNLIIHGKLRLGLILVYNVVGDKLMSVIIRIINFPKMMCRALGTLFSQSQSAHLLAQCVKDIFQVLKVTIGPVIT